MIDFKYILIKQKKGKLDSDNIWPKMLTISIAFVISNIYKEKPCGIKNKNI